MNKLKTTKQYNIIELDDKHYDEIAKVWEASVRASHHFLSEEDIVYYRPLVVTQYLPNLKLYGVKTDRNLAGFIAIDNSKIEMLFIEPESMGKGIGQTLLHFALESFHCCEVDVNEQNTKAVTFYKNNGFNVVSRSGTDSDGKPFPILHLNLNTLDNAGGD